MRKLFVLYLAIAAMTAGQMVFGQQAETMSASDSLGSGSESYDSNSVIAPVDSIIAPVGGGGQSVYRYPSTSYYTPARNCPLLFGGRSGNNYAGGAYYGSGSYDNSGAGVNSGMGPQSNTLAGANTLAGSYNYVGMETFGDMLGGVGGGGSVTIVETVTKTGILNFGITNGATFSGEPWLGTFTVKLNDLNGNIGSISDAQVKYKGNDMIPSTHLKTEGGIINEPSEPLVPSSPSQVSLSSYLESVYNLSNVTYNSSESTFGYVYSDGSGFGLLGTPSEGYYGIENGTNFQFLYEYQIDQLNKQTDVSAALSQSLVGRIKITEDLSPLPQDRFIFNYNYFHGVPSGNMKFAVNRFTPGIEKTFLNKLMSVELRLPMAVTMDSNLKSDGSTSLRSGQVGDLSITLKGLLLRRNKLIMTGGMTITAPTGKDIKYYNVRTGEQMLQYNNDSCHLMPYLGGLWSPSHNWFHQAYLQVDVDTNGRSVHTRPAAGTGLDYNGRAYDNTYLYGSVSSGRWLYRNDRKARGLTGWNVIGELHWTRSVNSSKDVVVKAQGYDFDQYRVGNFCDNFEMLNATIGTRMVFNQQTVLGLAYGTPLTRRDRQFDGELRVSLNHYF